MRREKEQDELTIDPPAEGHGPAGELERRERAEMVNAVIDTLPLRQREAVLLRYFEQLSVEQSATIMGCAPGTVKALVFQALRNMKDSLE
jgi:RNA polymerase sigma factor (sigma-70 family)